VLKQESQRIVPVPNKKIKKARGKVYPTGLNTAMAEFSVTQLSWVDVDSDGMEHYTQ